MSSWTAQLRRQEAARKREEREARRLYREFERDLKNQAHLSDLAQARLDVAAHEHAIEELTSIHKEQAPPVEWANCAVALPPHEAVRAGLHECAARLAQNTSSCGNAPPQGIIGVEEARRLDEQAHQAVHKANMQRVAVLTRLSVLAKRVLNGEEQAYAEAISEFEPFVDIPGLGSTARLTVHTPKLVGFMLTVSGRVVIPKEVKTLTGTGKLSVKAMPKGRAQDLYQDYICGCVLRAARELLALLPVDAVVVTACVEEIDERTGNRANLPVLSVVVERPTAARLNFERLQPSEALQNFAHRGDARTACRSGGLAPITPFTPEDVAPPQPERIEFGKLLGNVRQLRAEIGASLQPIVASDGEASIQPLHLFDE